MGLQRVAGSDAATAAIRELAERQYGVVAWRQLAELGLGKRLIVARVERGLLLPIHRGVFALGHRSVGLRGRWMAATLACGPSAVLSHGSAAHLWGVRDSSGPIEVTRRSGHRRPHGVWLHQTRRLPPEQVTVVDGIPVTSIERAFVDMAARLDSRQLERDLVTADRNRLLDWTELRLLVEEAVGKWGRNRLRRVIAEVDPRAADTLSPLEVDFLALCRRADLPAPEVNVRVEGRLVDFCWPASRLIVETDGYRYHDDRPAFERDHESTVALMNAGYKVLRATYRMLQRDPEPFLRLVRDSLGRPR
jgi:hypothetical protein